jgi:hypothetical protein
MDYRLIHGFTRVSSMDGVYIHGSGGIIVSLSVAAHGLCGACFLGIVHRNCLVLGLLLCGLWEGFEGGL